jgi:hypothetical protein
MSNLGTAPAGDSISLALIHRGDAGVFVALRGVALFNRVGVEYGAVTWPGELDLAPDGMYDDLQASAPNTVVKL